MRVASCAGGVTGLHSTGPSDGIFTWLVSWLLLLFLHLFAQCHTLAASDGMMALFLSVKIKLSVKSSYPVCFQFARGGCGCGLELVVWRMEMRLAGCVENGEETGWLCEEWRRDWLVV